MTAARPDHPADVLLRLAGELRRVMAEEVAIHRAGRPRDAEALIAEKARLAEEYRAAAKALQQDEAWLKDPASADARRRLKEELDRLAADIDRHARTIQRYRLLTEGVVRAVAEEVERRRTPFRGYGPAAARPPAAGSLAIDERL